MQEHEDESDVSGLGPSLRAKMERLVGAGRRRRKRRGLIELLSASRAPKKDVPDGQVS